MLCAAVSPAPEQQPPPEGYAIIVQNVGAGLALDFRGLLIERGGYSEGNILCYGSSEQLADCRAGQPTVDEITSGVNDLAARMSDGDVLLLMFLCHMRKGFLINDQLTYEELNELLTAIPGHVTTVVIIEGCHSAAALPVLDAADLAYASAGPDQPCYGGWLRFFMDALGRDENAHDVADADRDGRVSFGEAFDYSAIEEHLADWYANLPRDAWPPADFYPKPARTTSELEYSLFLNPNP